MGGYGAVRAALELGAHKALAFAPQTTLDVSARAAAGLPSSTFDTLLEGLAAFARVGCVELRGLDAVVEGLPPGQATDLELHVGSCDQGDVHEAERLKAAVDAHRERGELGGVASRLTCRVVVHPGADHNLVVGLRDRGELHRLLEALVAGEEDGAKSKLDMARPDRIPEHFDGFQDCPDF